MLSGTLKISITKSAAIIIVLGQRAARLGLDVLLFSDIKDTTLFKAQLRGNQAAECRRSYDTTGNPTRLRERSIDGFLSPPSILITFIRREKSHSV